MKKEEAFVNDITKILVSQKVISENDLKNLRKLFSQSDQESFDSFLIEEGIVSDTELLQALSIHYQVPSFDVVSHFFEHSQLIKFPKDVLLRNAIIPLEDDENILVMIAANPNDSNLLPEIGTYVSYDIQFRVGIRQDICDAVKEFYDISLTQQNNEQTLYDTPDDTFEIMHEKIEQAEQLEEDFIPDQDD